LLNPLQRLTQSRLVGIRLPAQLLTDRVGPGKDEMRTAIAQFQTLQTALPEIVLDLQIESHGINLGSG
jgi:hypothetical protein